MVMGTNDNVDISGLGE